MLIIKNECELKVNAEVCLNGGKNDFGIIIKHKVQNMKILC